MSDDLIPLGGRLSVGIRATSPHARQEHFERRGKQHHGVDAGVEKTLVFNAT
jgi:hypothetical protein